MIYCMLRFAMLYRLLIWIINNGSPTSSIFRHYLYRVAAPPHYEILRNKTQQNMAQQELILIDLTEVLDYFKTWNLPY